MESAIQLSCFDCSLRPDRVFCDLPADALEAFDAIKTIALYPRGTTLFIEGRPARGVFMLCDGRAKLTVCSGNGRRLTLRIAGPGEMLGLSAAVSGTPYEVTAEMLDNCQVAFVRRKDMLHFLRVHRPGSAHGVRPRARHRTGPHPPSPGSQRGELVRHSPRRWGWLGS
jgi:CRP/FNR family transcriptional regulator